MLLLATLVMINYRLITFSGGITKAAFGYISDGYA
jgi:hypothetical protein